MKNLKIKSLFLLALVSGNTYTCWKGLDTLCEYLAGCYCCYEQELWQAKQNGNARKQAAIAQENMIADRQLDSFHRPQQAIADQNQNKQNQTISNKKPADNPAQQIIPINNQNIITDQQRNSYFPVQETIADQNQNKQDQTINNMKPENNPAQQIIHSVSFTSTHSEHDMQDTAQHNSTHAVPNAFPDNNDGSEFHVLNRYNMHNQKTDHPGQVRIHEDSILGTNIEPRNHQYHYSNNNTHNANNSARGFDTNNQRLFVRQHTNNDRNDNDENFYNGLHLIPDNTTLNNSPMNSQYPTTNIKVKPYSGTSSYEVDSIIPHSNPE